MITIPSDEQIRAWHEEFAPTREAFDSVYTHCRIVCELAEQLHTEGDLELIRAGSLLHDIGVYRLGAGEYIRHGVLGHELLRGLGLPEELSRFCSHHTGVGLSSEDVRRQGLPLPIADYLPETVEEELVMYADKFHSKSSPPAFVSAESYSARAGLFGADKVHRFAELRERLGEPDLEAASRRFGHRIV
ncbi:HD domain-containing protein [Actinoplanes sp. GCM10030250]|uniref:HD domain-containing protein n=1 Tax=Actinoplanes sp. GCM10030250 TaxID=3273376 RepID=UPI00360AD685